jgi:superfamily II DNA or RNA helicase
VDPIASKDDSHTTLILSPHGHLYLGESDGRERVHLARAFERGAGHGLLHLGAVETASALPTDLAYWRTLGTRFLQAACIAGLLDVTELKGVAPPDAAALDDLVRSAPPIAGGEYLSAPVLLELWRETEQACNAELAKDGQTLGEWLVARSGAWSQVGRVHFHLAEQKVRPDTPFAFLATFTTRLSPSGTPQHLPLARALDEQAGREDRKAMLAMLAPVQRAAQRDPFIRELVDSKGVFQALSWTPDQAYRFLQSVPACTEAGLVVRFPDWWRDRTRPRPRVEVRIGQQAPSGMGLEALLDFTAEVCLDGAVLTPAEMRTLLASTTGLTMLRGRWVEVDRDKLKQVIDHWQGVRKGNPDGISFLHGMRLLSGASIDGSGIEQTPTDAPDWSARLAGDWLRRTLEELRGPSTKALTLGNDLKTELRSYQAAGVQWLWTLDRLGLGGCLADDMGLGKTIQIIALLMLLKRHGPAGPTLLVMPASLIANWESEMTRFAPALTLMVAHPSSSRVVPAEWEELASRHDVILTTYGYLSRLPWVSKRTWNLLVLDEAQQIKNPGARQTKAVKAVKSRMRLALTGTPVENRLGDLWSIFDFLNPGLLGSPKAFGKFTKQLQSSVPPDYGPLRSLVRPYLLRRLKTDRNVIQDLPDKTQTRAFCSLTKLQVVLYQQAVTELEERLKSSDGIQRRGIILATLTRLKQVCNHPAQWTHSGDWDPSVSGKFTRLAEIVEELAVRQEKVLVFTQYREMAGPLVDFLEGLFGRRGLLLDGSTPVKKRKELVTRFQEDERIPYFVLSLKAGGTGLNLTAASQVVHFDRWWNPAVESQATDRAFRIGQKKHVFVHAFVCRGTVEERIDQLMESKRELADRVVGESAGDILLTEMKDEELIQLVRLDINTAMGEG